MITTHVYSSERRTQDFREEPSADSRLRVTVVFTTVEATVCALRTACVFAKSLEARIALLAVEVVPYRLAVDQPTVPVELLEGKMVSLVSRATVEANEISIEIRMCRDGRLCLRQMLRPWSLVVIGGKNSPWSKERKLQKWLASLGHRVVFVDVNVQPRAETSSATAGA
jgi:hypothetical protein